MSYWKSYQHLIHLDLFKSNCELYPEDEKKAKDETNRQLYIPNTVCIARDWLYENSIKPTKQYARVSLQDAYNLFAKDKHLYEIITTDSPRCFYIDIDFDAKTNETFTKKDMDTHHKKIEKNINKFMTFLISDKLKLDIKLSNIFILTSSRPNKISIHFIYKDINFKNFETMNAFVSHFQLLIDKHPKQFDVYYDENDITSTYISKIDMNVYTGNRQFRTVNQSKINKPEYPLVCFYPKKGTSVKKLLIGYYEKCKLNFIDVMPVQEEVIKKVAIKKLSNWVCTITENDFDKYNHQVDLLIDLIPNEGAFIQNKPNWLKVGSCIKSIYNDNRGLELWIKWSIKAVEKYPNNKNNCIIEWNTLEAENLYTLEAMISEKSLYKKFKAIKQNALLTKFKVAEDIEKIDINTEFVGDIDNYFLVKLIEILLIKSKTGSGKTTAIINLLKKLMKQRQLKRFKFITTRRAMAYSITAELLEKSLNIVNYLKLTEKEINDAEYLTIQYESLHKLYNQENQVLILDEIESILNIFDSSTNDGYSINTEKNFNVFINLIKNSKYVIIADAGIACRTMELVNYIKGNRKVAFIENHYNEVKNKNSKCYYLGKAGGTTSKKYKLKFIDLVKEKIKANQNIYMVVGSRDFAKYIHNQLLCDESLNLNNKDLALYTSHTDDNTFNEELSDVKKHWSNKRVVITTSKITNGVDYNIKEHFNSVFLYMNNSSCVVRDYLQSLRRVRHLVDNDIYYMIAENNIYESYNTSIESLKSNTTITNPLWCKIVSMNIQERINTAKNLEFEVKKIFEDNGYKYVDIRFTIEKEDKKSTDCKSLPIDEEEYEMLFKQILNDEKTDYENITTQQKIYTEMRSLIRRTFRMLENRKPSFDLLQDVYSNIPISTAFNKLYDEKYCWDDTLEENVNENIKKKKLYIIRGIYQILNIDSFFIGDISCKDKENCKDLFTINQTTLDLLTTFFHTNKTNINNAFNLQSKSTINILKNILLTYTNDCIVLTSTLLKKAHASSRIYEVKIYAKSFTVASCNCSLLSKINNKPFLFLPTEP